MDAYLSQSSNLLKCHGAGDFEDCMYGYFAARDGCFDGIYLSYSEIVCKKHGYGEFILR